MVLREFLARLKPNDLIYLGMMHKTVAGVVQKVNGSGSGFVFIGPASDINTDLYGEREVYEAYHREVDYPGMVVIAEGLELGRYWFWHEYDPEIAIREPRYVTNPVQWEDLYFAIFSQSVKDYQSIIRKLVWGNKPTNIDELNDIIAAARKKAVIDGVLAFMENNASGQNLIRDAEDEIRIMFQHPEIAKIKKADDRIKAFRRERNKILRDRVKNTAKARYATIKGRSVNHDVD